MLTSKDTLRVIDSHCHLDMVEDRGISRDEMTGLLRENEITGLVHIAADKPGVEYLDSHILGGNDWPCPIYYTIGRHPGEVHEQDGYDGVAEIENRKSDSLFKAIGEIGLDYYYHEQTKELQQKIFQEYLEVAVAIDKPVCIHTRDAHEDTFRILKQVSDKIPILIHCFTGTPAEMQDFLSIGCMISFSGIVTFKNAENVRESALSCPPERMLVETDAPFLAPVPKRGKTNQPAYVIHTLHFLSELKSIPVDEFSEKIYQNTTHFYDL